LNKSGFTLIEVLLAAGLLVLALASFSYLTVNANRCLARTESLSRAAIMLQSRMEELKALPLCDLSALDQNIFAAGRGKVLITPLSSDLVMIELVSLQPKLQLFTLRSKY
jgi:Tfp pilus assembly protein PilV